MKNRWQGHVAVRVVALERPAEGFEGFGGFEAGQTAVLNPLKNRWQGHVVVALEACCGVWRTAVLNPLKNRWQGHVAVRVIALERPADGFGGFEAGQTAVLNPLKNRWQGHVAVRVVALEACCGVWRV